VNVVVELLLTTDGGLCLGGIVLGLGLGLGLGRGLGRGLGLFIGLGLSLGGKEYDIKSIL
jgi:hypothetical protein